MQVLRRGRVTTARRLAERLEVSERTIYRDVADLLASGVPIEGEAGVGYRLRHFDLPPLMFTRDEIEALVFGARMVESWTDPELAAAARGVLDKVESALPGEHHQYVQATPLFAPGSSMRPAAPAFDLGVLRRGIRHGRKLGFAYTDANGAESQRTVRPLGLAFFGPVWILLAWCELRRDFRAFRPDRMRNLELLEETFAPEPGRTLADYMARVV